LKLFAQFKLEQNLTDIILDQLEAGNQHVRRTDLVLKDDNLQFLCKNYKRDNIIEFLDAIASN
jgi:hypothetical protein